MDVFMTHSVDMA